MDREFLEFVDGRELVIMIEMVSIGIWVARTELDGRELSVQCETPELARDELLMTIRTKIRDPN